MADYADHLNQSVKNLEFLSSINKHCNKFLDWQVTTSFYVGVHLINGFLAKEGNLHFNSHERVKDAISPHSSISKTRLDQTTYLAYIKLRNLSRRARYLCNHNDPNSTTANFTHEKHFLKALQYVDALLAFFYKKYGHPFSPVEIKYNFTIQTPNCIYFKFARL